MMTHLQQAIAAERLKGLFDQYELGILEAALTEYVRSSNMDYPPQKRIAADRLKAVVMEASERVTKEQDVSRWEDEGGSI